MQAGFAAEGVESGTVFSDINLQEKVRDLAALWGAIWHLVGIILSVNKALQRDAASTLLSFLLVILVSTITQRAVLKRYLVITCRKAGMCLLEKIHLG